LLPELESSLNGFTGQKIRWFGVKFVTSGADSLQLAFAYLQRVWKAQPVGKLPSSGGMPSIESKFFELIAEFPGSAAISPLVYG
jgi:hypothetical protein